MEFYTCILQFKTELLLILFQMCSADYENMMKLLIDNGADINAVNMYKNTALILAITKGKTRGKI